MSALEIVLALATAILLVPIAVLVGECALSLFPARRRAQGTGRPRVAVLIAAHDEEADIAATIDSLRPQLRPGDRLVVVADNCTDATATVARRHAAEVCPRTNPHRRGKGYALDYGLCHLAQDPPDVVVMVDADCTVHAGAVDALACEAVAAGRPIQAVYLMDRPEPARPNDVVSALALLVKNMVRPLGLQRAGLPCLLTGSGMAFPWHVIRRAHLGSGNIVEDMQLALDLAVAGAAPRFCGAALISGRLPANPHAARTQRTRWEHGHLSTLLREVPRLFGAALRQRRAEVLALALDLCVPPLSLLVMLWTGAIVLASVSSVFSGRWWPVLALQCEGALMVLAILAVWYKHARHSLPLSTLLAVPWYLAWKVPLYLGFLLHPQRDWVRTERVPDKA